MIKRKWTFRKLKDPKQQDKCINDIKTERLMQFAINRIEGPSIFEEHLIIIRIVAGIRKFIMIIVIRDEVDVRKSRWVILIK